MENNDDRFNRNRYLTGVGAGLIGAAGGALIPTVVQKLQEARALRLGPDSYAKYMKAVPILDKARLWAALGGGLAGTLVGYQYFGKNKLVSDIKKAKEITEKFIQ